jgi:hypothetical protein
MQLSKHHWIGQRQLQAALISLAICSLTVNLATRFWTSNSSQFATVKSVNSPTSEPLRQHLDRDATQWVAPTAPLRLVEPTETEVNLIVVGPLPRTHVFLESLYNRPPPSSEFFL